MARRTTVEQPDRDWCCVRRCKDHGTIIYYGFGLCDRHQREMFASKHHGLMWLRRKVLRKHVRFINVEFKKHLKHRLGR